VPEKSAKTIFRTNLCNCFLQTAEKHSVAV